MIQEKIHGWTEAYMICYLYKLIAYADFVIQPEETEALNDKLDELFYHKYGFEKEYASKIILDVETVLYAADVLQQMEIVKELAKKFQISYDLYLEIVNDMSAIAKSDKFVSVDEHSLMYFFKLKFKRD